MTREVTPTMPQPPENYCRYGNLSVSTKTTTFLKPMDLGYSTLAHQNPPSVLLRSRAENRRRTVRPSRNAQKCRETSDFWRLWWSGLNSWVASVMWAAARSASTTNLGGMGWIKFNLFKVRLRHFDALIGRTRGRPALYRLANASCYGTEDDLTFLRNLRVKFLPKRTTYILQRLDLGVIATIMKKYLDC